MFGTTYSNRNFCAVQTVFTSLNYTLSLLLRVLIAFVIFLLCLSSFNFTNEGRDSKIRQSQLATSKQLYEQVRVFCLITTGGDRHKDHAVHVLRTWAQHCNKFLFVSNERDSELETVKFGVTTKWGLVKTAFKYVYNYHFTEADWFLRADDETFTILENLRYFLKNKASNSSTFFGHKSVDRNGVIFMHGKSGYVLSKSALQRFIKDALPNATICKQDNDGYEDIEIAKCLQNVGVEVGETRDFKERDTFLPFSLLHHMKGLDEEAQNWTKLNSFYGLNNNTNRPARYLISFSEVSSDMMYDYNYFIYKVRLFGSKTQVTNRSIP